MKGKKAPQKRHRTMARNFNDRRLSSMLSCARHIFEWPLDSEDGELFDDDERSFLLAVISEACLRLDEKYAAEHNVQPRNKRMVTKASTPQHSPPL